MEQMDFFGAVHDHVSDPGNYIGADFVGHAVFGHQVPVVAPEAAAEHHFGLADGAGDVFETFLHRDHGLDIEMAVHAVLFHQFVHVLALAQDHHGLFGRELPEVPLVGRYGPAGDQEELEQEGGHEGEEGDVVPVDQDGDEIQDTVADQGGQGLAVHQLVNAADGQAVAVVQMGGEVVEQAEQEHHDQVAHVVEGMGDLVFVEVFPAEPKGPGDQQDVQSVKEFLLYFVVHGCIHIAAHWDLLIVDRSSWVVHRSSWDCAESGPPGVRPLRVILPASPFSCDALRGSRRSSRNSNSRTRSLCAAGERR